MIFASNNGLLMSIDTQHNDSPDAGGFRKPPSTIFDVIGVLTRRWWLIVLLTFVGLIVAFVYTARQEKVYEADATTLVQRQSLAKSLNNIVDPGAQVNEGPARARGAGQARQCRPRLPPQRSRRCPAPGST